MIETRRNNSQLKKGNEWITLTVKKKSWKKRLKKNVKETGLTHAISNKYAHLDDQSIKNMIRQEKTFKRRNLELGDD